MVDSLLGIYHRHLFVAFFGASLEKKARWRTDGGSSLVENADIPHPFLLAGARRLSMETNSADSDKDCKQNELQWRTIYPRNTPTVREVFLQGQNKFGKFRATRFILLRLSAWILTMIPWAHMLNRFGALRLGICNLYTLGRPLNMSTLSPRILNYFMLSRVACQQTISTIEKQSSECVPWGLDRDFVVVASTITGTVSSLQNR